MVKIAIVEDERAYQEQFFAYVKKYEAESGERMEISIFSDGYEIVEKYNASYDIIFLDIQLVVMDGMETAKKFENWMKMSFSFSLLIWRSMQFRDMK